MAFLWNKHLRQTFSDKNLTGHKSQCVQNIQNACYIAAYQQKDHFCVDFKDRQQNISIQIFFCVADW